MKLSKSYFKTYKEAPSDAEVISHKLLLRAGFIHKISGGIYSYLPLAKRVLRKVEDIVRDELDSIGAQEITMSMVTPSELWIDSGRWDTMGKEMLRFKDRKEADFCLSPTNEETVTDIFRKTVTSYKELPINLYQINTKFRDEVRPRFGLLRGREFIMKDAYSFHLDKKSLDETYEDYYKAYSNIIKRMGLDFIIVEADAGAMGNKESKTHEFQVIADSGEDIVVTTENHSYAANIEKAQTVRLNLDFLPEANLEEVETKNLQSCEEVASFLKLKPYQTLKTLVVTAHYEKKSANYMVLLLGDDTLNEVKLKNYLGAVSVEHASEEVLKEFSLVKGYMSPLGSVQDKISILLDSSIDETKSYIVGANKENFHIKGFTPKRDIKNYKTLDARLAREGDYALDKTSKIIFKKGIEVGHIFQLGNKYTKSMKAKVLDQNGKDLIPEMGCYGIGVSRMMAAAIEQSHDDDGIIWPASIAPYHVYFAVIGKKEETKKLANDLYDLMKKNGIEVLFDDREMGPGPMFKDSDLIGLPIRVVLGERDYENSKELELKIRKTKEVLKVSKESLVSTLLEKLKGL